MSDFIHNGMPFKVRIEADTISPAGSRITTFVLTYPYFVHAQLLTHRVFSRNAQSSRAMPTATLLKQPPAIPVEFGANQKGMQPGSTLDKDANKKARELILSLYQYARDVTRELERLGVHKQWANRYVSPFQTITAIYTGTASAWDGFLSLRAHPDAQEEIQVLANAIKQALAESRPTQASEHVPFVSGDEATSPDRFKLSTARCARVSYLTFDGTRDPAKDLDLYNRLLTDKHMSPFEHAAVARPGRHANFDGWCSHRFGLENRAPDVEGLEALARYTAGFIDNS